MANEFHIRVIKLAKYEELRPAAYGVNPKSHHAVISTAAG